MPILTLDTELHSTVCKLTIYATMLSIHLTYLVFHFYKFFCCRRKRALYLQWHFVCAKLLYIASNCIASQCDTHTISLYVGCASIIGMLLTTSQCSLCRLIQYVSVEYLFYLSLFFFRSELVRSCSHFFFYLPRDAWISHHRPRTDNESKENYCLIHLESVTLHFLRLRVRFLFFFFLYLFRSV